MYQDISVLSRKAGRFGRSHFRQPFALMISQFGEHQAPALSRQPLWAE
jgi:hypothetical protein